MYSYLQILCAPPQLFSQNNASKIQFFVFFSQDARFLRKLSSLIIEHVNRNVLLNLTKLDF